MKKTTKKTAAVAASTMNQNEGAEVIATHKTYSIYKSGYKFYGFDSDADHTTTIRRSKKQVIQDIDEYIGDADALEAALDMPDPAEDAATLVLTPEEVERVHEGMVEILGEPSKDEAVAPAADGRDEFGMTAEDYTAADAQIQVRISEESTPEPVADTPAEEPVIDGEMVDTSERPTFLAFHTVYSHDVLKDAPSYISPATYHTLYGAQGHRTAVGGANCVVQVQPTPAFWLSRKDGEGFAEWVEITQSEYTVAVSEGTLEARALRGPAVKPQVVPAATTPAAPAAKKAATKKVTGGEGVITVLVAGNPKKAGSKRAARFALYRDGMTVAQALEAGLYQRDIDKDLKKGYIAVDGKTSAKVVTIARSASAAPAADNGPAAPVVATTTF